jgi:hypothetical protein
VFERFLSTADAGRLSYTLGKLGRHDIRGWALTGGLAVEIHRLRRGCPAFVRPLNDIDFVADSFDSIPDSLAGDFLFRHIHPFDPPGKTILQFVDPESALRIDVFRAYGATLSRSSNLNLPTGMIQIISLEDLAARIARLALDMAGETPIPSKYATDFLRLAGLVDPATIETAWLDQRKPGHPGSFKEANQLLQDLIPARPDLLMTPTYSQDPAAVCSRCTNTSALRLSDPKVLLSLLGYC